ncbi:GGDEF domain-containing protein [uncultured Sphaerochaeta sp.]|uniref:GGDEF domain-containing protein n=1 Tax=uncultured Sphaerochaeta sp. TaxID=886478 RepID=UPI002A0A7399|nr:GGDEF domain-containing protein [uncultured Sphaerochaeta sp.]
MEKLEVLGNLKVLLKRLHIFMLGLLPCILAMAFFIIPTAGGEQRDYVILLLGLFVFTLFAYLLNGKGYYFPSALLTVLLVILGTWGSFFLEYHLGILDLFPLVYVTISIMAASIFLPLIYTIVLTLLQFLFLIAVLLLFPIPVDFNVPSLLVFVLTVSILSISSNYLRKNQVVQLQGYAIKDHLTGLFNRRYFDETLEQKLFRAKQQDYTLSLIMVDIDKFKQYNDQFGHDAGDAVIKAVANLLLTYTDLEDSVCRYGGDEFAIIVSHSKTTEVLQEAEKIRLEAKKLIVSHNGHDLGPITFSLGISSFPNQGNTWQALVASADQALFRAKQEGRDRVFF